MKILNYGSLNLDYTYMLDHIVVTGETISSTTLEIFPGGKGLNQSVALARAGAEVYHAGLIGTDGTLLLETCRENGVNTDYIRTVQGRSGHAIIQVSKNGENCIVLFGGANRANTREQIDAVLAAFEPGDLLLLQNEMNLPEYLIDRAAERGMVIALNPSPYDQAMEQCNLSKVNVFLINEVEGQQITGESEPEAILQWMQQHFPKAKVVLTLGSRGVMYCENGNVIHQSIYRVKTVDTTAAGDTFTGYFLQQYTSGIPTADALRLASKASAIAVSRMGATPSIPWMKEVMESELTEVSTE